MVQRNTKSANHSRAAGSTHGSVCLSGCVHVSVDERVGFHFDVNPCCKEPSGCSLPPNLTVPLMVLWQLKGRLGEVVVSCWSE